MSSPGVVPDRKKNSLLVMLNNADVKKRKMKGKKAASSPKTPMYAAAVEECPKGRLVSCRSGPMLLDDKRKKKKMVGFRLGHRTCVATFRDQFAPVSCSHYRPAAREVHRR